MIRSGIYRSAFQMHDSASSLGFPILWLPKWASVQAIARLDARVYSCTTLLFHQTDLRLRLNLPDLLHPHQPSMVRRVLRLHKNQLPLKRAYEERPLTGSSLLTGAVSVSSWWNGLHDP